MITPERRAAWQNARNLLLVRLDNLGDVLMTTPAIDATAAPGRRLTLLTSRAGAALAGHLPRVDEVLPYDAPWVQGPVRSGADDRRFVARLARRRFDAAIVFTVCTQSALPAALLLRLAGIPLRLAYSRENPYDLLTDRLPETDAIAPGMRHEVRRQLDLVGAAGFGAAPNGERLVFVPRASDGVAVRRRLAGLGLAPDAPYLVVHPGSSAASRRYPAERFGVAAAQVAAATGAAIVFAGGADDAEACAIAARAAGRPSLTLSGTLALGELAALIDGARLCLCNNSGPAHLAAALQTPVVVLYALTNPQHTPWAVPARVLSREVPCRDCLRSICPERHHRCLLGIEAGEVAAAALDLWSGTE